MIEVAASLKVSLEGRYLIERELGRGGMATVYLARDLRHDRLVALKVLAHTIGRAIGPERFQREVLLTARLHHPHILPVLDSGEADGTLWYTMPFVDGETLRERLRRLRQLPLDEAARLTREIAAALDEAHRHGIVHRDIKPENVILTRGGHALVADFGIAKMLPRPHRRNSWETLTEEGLILGTPEYMSPEQATGDGLVDARSDSYALGCLTYEMLTGEPPFNGATAQNILAKRLALPAPSVRMLRETVPPEWDDALERALARTPADRFSTAGEFAAALTTGGRARPKVTLPRILVAAVALVSALGGTWLIRLTATTRPLDSRVVAILPFETASPDTGLQRLGRDLVFTLSATMDGVGDVRTTDAHSALALDSGEARNQEARSRDIARRLGAGRVVEGSLVREGPLVRVEAVVYTTGEATRITRASVALPADSIAPMTDSLTLRLLPSLLGGGALTANSLEGAFRTHSLASVRNFLDGEQRISEDRWGGAIAAFDKAFAGDTTFWLAAARLAFCIRWNNGEIPAKLQADLHRHRDQLPLRERLEVEAHQALTSRGVSASLAAHRVLVGRFPESWFGWLSYGDVLFHNGPSLGEPLEDARSAFRRVMDLNPRLAPGWDHDALLAALARDSVRLRTGLAALERMRPRPKDEYADKVLAFRLLDALVRHDSVAEASALDSMARDKVKHGRRVQTFYDPVRFGFPLSQIKLSRAVLANGGGALAEHELKLQIAQAFAAAGQWDSAFAVAPTGLDRYRLAVLAAALGVVPWARALELRSPGGTEPEWVFLDGVAAAATGDSRGALAAMARLAALRKPAGRIGAEALRWLARAAAGDSVHAGRGLADLEWKLGEWNYQGAEALPILPPLDRIFGARWLAVAGERDEAKRLLHWADSPFLIAPSMDYMAPVRPYLRRQLELLGGP